MANLNNLTAAGLYTFQNYMSNIPQGALVRAQNVVIDRDGIVEPARGFVQYANIGLNSDRAKQMLDYKSRLLVHYTDKLAYDDNAGTFTALKKTYNEVESGLRLKYIELNGNLYITTSDGIKKVATTSASPFPSLNQIEEVDAGGVKAADIEAIPDYSLIGFLSEYSKVAYRVLWLSRDINNNLIIGYPSARYEVANPTNKSCQVKINITVPQDIVDGYADTPKTEYFYQIYRSSVVQSPEPFSLENLNEVSSSDEMRLVYEDYPTATQLSNRLIEVTDVVTEDYRNGGANLYTNEISGSGIAQANYRPPISKDIALYKNTAFFSNTKTYHNMNIALTGIGDIQKIDKIQSITYNSGVTSIQLIPDIGGKNGVVVAKTDNTFTVSYTTISGLEVGYSATATNLPGEASFIGAAEIINIDGNNVTYNKPLIGNLLDLITLNIFSYKFFELNQYFVLQGVNKSKPNHYLNNTWKISDIDYAAYTIKINTSDWTTPTGGTTTGPVVATDAAIYTSYIIIGKGLDTERYFFVGQQAIQKATFSNKPEAGSYFTIASMDDAQKYYVWYEVTTPATKEEVTITCTADLSSPDSLNNEYFYLNTADNKTYYVWYNVDGNGIDPLINGAIGVQVSLSAGATSTQVAIATWNQLKYNTDFELESTAPTSATMIITNSLPGEVADSSNAGITPFSFSINPGVDAVNDGSDPEVDLSFVGIKVNYTTEDTLDQIITKTAEAITNSSYNFQLETFPTYLLLLTPLSGLFNSSSFIASTSPNSFVVFSNEQEGYGENTEKKYIRWSEITAQTQTSYSVILEDTARSLVKIINKSSQIIDASYESTASDIPGKMFFESLELDEQGFFLLASYNIGDNFSPDISEGYDSSNEISPNRLYYSKTNEPEHVPKLNYIDIGPKDKQIIRIVGLQDSLFIFKEEGIYRLTGENSTNFNVKLHDSSGVLVAPDSIAVLNNQIYCFTTQGIVAVSEAGMNIISRPIENVILKARENTNFNKYTFGLASETDRAFLIFTTEDKTDTSASVVYRYNIFTRAWTSLTKSATCGTLNTRTDKFFLGASDENLIEEERKTYSRRDFAGRKYDISFIRNTKTNNSIKISSSTNVEIGDVIIQTQYVTISFFNRLLARLDIDPGIKDIVNPNYFKDISAVAGDDLNDKIIELQNKLLIKDPSGNYNYTPQSTFQEMQESLNSNIIDKLNNSTIALFTNYENSIGTTEYEIVVNELNSSINKISTKEFLPIVAGPCVVHKYIPVDVIWAPQHFGEPNTLKHVRESTIMFEDTAFTEAILGFNTDLSGNFESITFNMTGDGLWGMDPYDTNPWGGTGMAVPFRTYVPRQKQRCRFIRSRFQTQSSFTKFAVLGLSYTFEVSSERAYK